MKHLICLALATAATLPTLALAHPGHFDEAPHIHDLTHGWFYTAMVIAVATMIAQHAPRLTKWLSAKKRARHDQP